MRFREALEYLKKGHCIKRKEWIGYWKIENGETTRVMMHCKNGDIIDLQDTSDIIYTLSNIAADDWEVLEDEDREYPLVLTMRFGDAIRAMKAGNKVAREGWNGKNMFVVYQKGYPEGIPCNKQTAEAYRMNEGDLFICNPYFQIRCVDGSHSMWVPSINDCLAEDWYVVEG